MRKNAPWPSEIWPAKPISSVRPIVTSAYSPMRSYSATSNVDSWYGSQQAKTAPARISPIRTGAGHGTRARWIAACASCDALAISARERQPMSTSMTSSAMTRLYCGST